MLRVINVCPEREENPENQVTVLDHYYFCFITFGKCIYWVNHKKMILEKGDILLIPGHIIFKWKHIPSVFHAKYIVYFQVDRDCVELPLLMNDSPTHLHTGHFSILHDKLKIVENQWTDKLPYYETYASAVFMQMLAHINRELDKGPVPPKKHKYAEMMKRYIRENYQSKVTKEELADVIQKSPNYTATLFSHVTGQTISEYVHSIRMKKAIYMLEESQLTIAELSEFLGYNDVSYFSRVFKQSTGVAPSEYKHHKTTYL